VSLGRVTWLVLGTAMVLVSAVIVAALLFVNGAGQRLPRGAGNGASGVARVEPARAGPANARPGGVRLASSAGGRRVAAHPSAAGVTASLVTAGRRHPRQGPPGPGGPTGRQYGTSLQLLRAALAR
jgi:hypothetical protein